MRKQKIEKFILDYRKSIEYNKSLGLPHSVMVKRAEKILNKLEQLLKLKNEGHKKLKYTYESALINEHGIRSRSQRINRAIRIAYRDLKFLKSIYEPKEIIGVWLYADGKDINWKN